MDLAPTAEQRAFRTECRAWLQANLPWDYGTGLPPRCSTTSPRKWGSDGRWQRRLAAAGYVGVTWPVAYGGRGADPVFNFIVQEELARARAPELVGRIGVNLVGPCLLAHGTDTQKQRWLPGILNAERLICQLFSEPDAEATSPRCAAGPSPPTGAGWLHGRKVWTSYAQFADWGLCLARTDPEAPERAGITVFMVDMRAPGVEVRPLRQITAESDFNEVIFDDVFVADDQVVGEINAGWAVAGSVLAGERGTNPRQLVIHSQLLEELVRLAGEQGLAGDPRTAQDLAQAFVEVRLFQLQNWRALSNHAPRPPARRRDRHRQALLERDEPAPAFRRPEGAGRCGPRCGEARTATLPGAAGSGRGSTTGLPRSSRAPARSSATSSASEPWACPASPAPEAEPHREALTPEGACPEPLTHPHAYTWHHG